jgi:Putative Actinobacterial Holin-X, holin superfamily III
MMRKSRDNGGFVRNFIANSISELIGDLKESITTFIRKEVELAKKEMSEKMSTYTRNGVKLVVGGSVAYAGLIVFLAGIGLIIGFGFETLGLDTTLAVFIGLSIVGILAGSIGALVALQGIKAISAVPPLPEKTIAGIKQLTDGSGTQTSNSPGTDDPRSSDALHASASGAAERFHEGKEGLVFKLSPRHWKEHAVRHIKEHPLMWSAAALGGAATMATGGILLGRKILPRRGIGAIKRLVGRR